MAEKTALELWQAKMKEADKLREKAQGELSTQTKGTVEEIVRSLLSLKDTYASLGVDDAQFVADVITPIRNDMELRAFFGDAPKTRAKRGTGAGGVAKRAATADEIKKAVAFLKGTGAVTAGRALTTQFGKGIDWDTAFADSKEVKIVKEEGKKTAFQYVGK